MKRFVIFVLAAVMTLSVSAAKKQQQAHGYPINSALYRSESNTWHLLGPEAGGQP